MAVRHVQAGPKELATPGGGGAGTGTVTVEPETLVADVEITTSTAPAADALLIKIIAQEPTGTPAWNITWDALLFDPSTPINIRYGAGKRTSFIFAEVAGLWYPISIRLDE